MNIIDKEGYVKPCVLEAKERGVIFDLSHGTNAYSYDTAEKRGKQDFYRYDFFRPARKECKRPVYNLGVVLTKVRGLTRKPWWWILKKAVVEPVRLLHIQDKAVNVQEGMLADLTVFRIDKGEFIYPDSKKENRTFQEKITAVYTCVESKVYVCRK